MGNLAGDKRHFGYKNSRFGRKIQNYLHILEKSANFAVELTTCFCMNLLESSVDDIRLWFCLTFGTNRFYHLNNDFFYVLGCHIVQSPYDYTVTGNVSMICTDGWARCMVDGRDFVVRAHDLLVLMAGSHVTVHEASDDFCFNNFIMSSAFSVSLQIQNQFAVYMKAHDRMLASLSERQWTYHQQYEQLIISNLRHIDHPFRPLIVRRLIELQHYQMTFDELPAPATSKDDLSGRFRDLLEREYTHHHDVAFYADRLCVTPKYLSECIKKASNQTAGQWIDTLLMRDAERLLQTTSQSVLEIATTLGFDDPSAFGKYFKRQKGISPRAFREKRG